MSEAPRSTPPRLPGLGSPMQARTAGAWSYPVNPFDLQRQLEQGMEHHRAGRFDEAERIYAAILAKVPGQPDALNLLGVIAMEAGNHDTAFELLGRAITARPKDPVILNNYGNALSLVRRHEEAIEHLERALAINPAMADSWLNLGRTLNLTGQGDRALGCFAELQRLKPDSLGARAGRARALLSLGRTAEAEQASRELIAAAPEAAGGYVSLSNARKFRPADPEIAEVERMIESRSTASREIRGLCFAAAKMCDDVGRYADAFAYFDRANRAAGGTCDRQQLEQSYAELKLTYTKAFFEARKAQGVDSERPVFIVGMPRSGTTLTETIIGAHPMAFAAGELETIKRCERDMGALVARDEGIQKNAQHLSWFGVEVLARRYLDTIDRKARDSNAIRVTDKMPHNFQAVGFLSLLFPKARIIHVRRNPMDTCLSIWQQNFNDSHSYARNLEDLGHHYAHYLGLMQHWREVLPGRMLEVDYEDLVANQEEETRRLIDHVGLPWDEVCLRPQDVKRTVLTASVWQVRQPVYRKSAGRWKNYGDLLRPLRDTLASLGCEVD